jgi:hypothetical protein
MMVEMEIEEIIDRKTFREYEMLHLCPKNSRNSRWQIIHNEGGVDRHQGFAVSEDEARSKIDEFIDRKQRKTPPRYSR